MKLYVSIAACLLSMATASQSATLIVENSILKGATGVAVGGVLYDVSFVPGSCVSVFGGCTDNSNFDFFNKHQTRYRVAAQSIVNQIFINDPQGNFDTNPSLIFGCSVTCNIAIPSQVNLIRGRRMVSVSWATNYPGIGGAATLGGIESNTSTVYARFTQTSTSVPEPASWAMLISGFGIVGVMLRRRAKFSLPLPN